MPPRTPDFLGIGFRRCASSWIHLCLNEHPQIGKPPRGVHFFSTESEYAKGLPYYEQMLESSADCPVVGEFSVSYAYPDVYEKVAERIYSAYPEATIIAVVRNPIDRAYSDFRRSVYFSEIDSQASFLDAIKGHPELLTRGLYGKILNAYGHFYGPRMTVLFHDDLLNSPEAFVQQLYRVLNVDPFFVPSVLREPRGHARSIRSRWAERIIQSIQTDMGGVLRSMKLESVIKWLKRSGLQSYVLGLNQVREEPISQVERLQLSEFYRDDLRNLEKLTGRSTHHWLVS